MPESVGIPPRMFLYTLDQVATIIQISVVTLKREYIYFDGRSIGAHKAQYFLARNIADGDNPEEWRIAEHELVRWMQFKGFRYYERGWTLQ